ncbi:MAG: hypothetical protein HY236_13100 [Acidobacteria bacterium]|nr:hypothetical protein [Acidobacteriota bacterium]
MLSSKLIRSSGLLALLGSVLWTATWILASRDVFGLSERGWRTLLLNPAMLFFMAGLVGFHAKQAGRSESLAKGGFVICLLALGTMLLGNIIEFWVSELFYGTQQPGWDVMGVGLLLLPIGLLLFGIGTLKARVFSGWRRAVPFVFGLILALLVLSGVALILLSGSQPQKGFFGAVFLSIAAGWAVLGFALWSDNGKGASRSGQGAC